MRSRVMMHDRLSETTSALIQYATKKPPPHEAMGALRLEDGAGDLVVVFVFILVAGLLLRRTLLGFRLGLLRLLRRFILVLVIRGARADLVDDLLQLRLRVPAVGLAGFFDALVTELDADGCRLDAQLVCDVLDAELELAFGLLLGFGFRLIRLFRFAFVFGHGNQGPFSLDEQSTQPIIERFRDRLLHFYTDSYVRVNSVSCRKQKEFSAVDLV